MLTTFEVAGDANEADLPEADVEVTGVEYSFSGPTELDAGEVILDFTNGGAEPHEVNIVRLNDGVTVADYLAGFETGPPPGVPVGGVQAVLPGRSQRAVLDLDAGNYGFICFIPNAEGVPHAALGMATDVRVE